ncbi:uncharacterized protein LOC144146591 [Haemaphysalis longicornis]
MHLGESKERKPDDEELEGRIAEQRRRILKEHRFPPAWRVAWLGAFCLGFSSTVDSALKDDVGALHGSDMATTLQDVKEISQIAGFVVACVLVQAVGRLTGLFFYATGICLSNLATIVAENKFLICVFQAVSSIFYAVGVIGLNVYLVEVAPNQDRGVVLGILHIVYLLGRLVALFYPDSLPWYGLALLSMLPFLVFMSLMQHVVESPRWLLQVNRTTDAQRCFELLGMPMAGDECALMAIRIQRLHTPFMAVLCAMSVFALRLLGGQQGVAKLLSLDLYEMNKYFRKMHFIVVGFELAVMPVVIFLADAVGRRFLIYSSGLLLTLFQFGTSYLLQRIAQATTLREGQNYENVAACVIIFFVAAHSLGVGPVGYLVCAEVVPPRGHGLLAGLCYGAVAALFFAFRWYLRERDQLYFLLAGLVTGAALLVLVLYLPETKLLALDKIPGLFSSDPVVRANSARIETGAHGGHVRLQGKGLRHCELKDFHDELVKTAQEVPMEEALSAKDKRTSVE